MPDDHDGPWPLEYLQLLVSDQVQALRVHARQGTDFFIVLACSPAAS
jgi:hypothetical protein